jgi:hypothetical protein
MRLAALGLLFASALIAGCSSTPPTRPEPNEFKGTVKLPGGKSAKGLTVTLRPTDNQPLAGGKCGADGSFSLKTLPGTHIVYFDEEANAGVPAYKDVPQAYRKPQEANTVKVAAGEPITVEVK